MKPIRRTLDELLSSSDLFHSNENGFGELKDFLSHLIENVQNQIDLKLDPKTTIYERFLTEWIRILDLNEPQDSIQDLIHKVKHRVTYSIQPGLKGLEDHIQKYSGLNIRFKSRKPCHVEAYGLPFEEVDENRIGSAFKTFSRREPIIREINRVKPVFWKMEYKRGEYEKD